MTSEERKADKIAQHLVDALLEFEEFTGDSDMILDAAAIANPTKKEYSPMHLIEIRLIVNAIREYYNRG